MQEDLNALKEKMDEVRHQTDRQIGRTSREGDQRVKELESRIAKAEENLKAREEELKALREKPGMVSGDAQTTTEFQKETVSGESEAVKRDYDEAWKSLDRKDYRTAILRFRDFLKKHPKSNLADNAQYWIGECYYALKEFDQAIIAFDEVERRYPNGDKVPAALLKQGFAFAELANKGDARFKVDARLILQKLIEKYPKSEEAAKARQKLKALES
jgi:tol-pal system protein YbgF